MTSIYMSGIYRVEYTEWLYFATEYIFVEAQGDYWLPFFAIGYQLTYVDIVS